MKQIIFHIDVNSAFLSWTAVEQLKQGAEVDLRTVPAIIGGNQESRHTRTDHDHIAVIVNDTRV